MRLERDTFGPYLRHARERRNISLDDISARTKIARSLLAKLERGDMSDWPSGIFRRSFFREYATAIGVEVDELLEEFLRLFPDPAAESAPPRERTDLRLTLDSGTAAPRVSSAGLRRAALDSVAIVAVSAAIALVVGHGAAVVAVVAIAYHAAATATGRQLGARTVADPARLAAPEDALAQPRGRGEGRRHEPIRRPLRGRRRNVVNGVPELGIRN